MKIGIVGAGISGLCTAYQLQNLGAEVTIIESSGRVGGAIASVREGEFLAEHGPQTLVDNNPYVGELIEALGLEDQRIFAEKSGTRFAVKDGVVQPLPASPPAFLKTPLYSGMAKLRLLKEPFIKPLKDAPDESVRSFVERRLGREFFDYGLDLLVNGIWAGDPDRLSVRHAFKKMYALERDYGSLIKGGMKQGKKKADGAARPTMSSFRGGIQVLTDTLAAQLDDIVLNASVEALKRDNGQWDVDFVQDGTSRSLTFDAVVMTAPVWAQSKMLVTADGQEPYTPELPVKVNHPPLAVLTLGFKREDVAHPLDGFGMLIPNCENRPILGSMFTSTLFEGRAPAGHVTLANFIGGARNPDIVDLSADERLEIAVRELRDLLGVTGDPVWVHEFKVAAAIPQYELGYGKNLVAMQAFEKRFPGLHLHGNFRDGVALPDLIRAGSVNASKIMKSAN